MASRFRQILKALGSQTVILVLAILILGGLFVFSIPIGYTDDEYAHIPRAYSISRAHFVPRYLGDGVDIHGRHVRYFGDEVPRSIVEIEGFTVINASRSRCQLPATVEPTPLKCGDIHTSLDEVHKLASAPLNQGDSIPIDFGGAGAYPALPYIPAAIGIGVVRQFNVTTGTVVYAGRIASLLTYALVVGAAMYVLRGQRTKWIVFTVALLPQSLVAASSVGVDMLLDCLSLLFFALVMAILHKESSYLVKLSLLLVALILPILKLPYLLISLLILALPIFRSGRKGIIQRLLVLIIVIGPTIAYYLSVLGIQSSQATPLASDSAAPDSALQLHNIMSNPILYVETIVRSTIDSTWLRELFMITHQHVQLPFIITVASYILMIIVALCVGQLEVTSWYRKVITAFSLSVITTYGAILSALYITYTPLGSSLIQGVQGRYFLPIVPFSLVIIGSLVRLKVQPVRRHATIYMIATLSLSCISLIYYVHAVYA